MDNEELLKKIGNLFFVDNGEIHWNYQEGISVNSIDMELAEAMKKYIKDGYKYAD